MVEHPVVPRRESEASVENALDAVAKVAGDDGRLTEDLLAAAARYGAAGRRAGLEADDLIGRWLAQLPAEIATDSGVLGAVVREYSRVETVGKTHSSATGQLTSPLDRLTALHRISQAATASLELDSMLDTIVNVVRDTVAADAASLFLFEQSSSTLVLRATAGLNQDAIGRVTLALGAGITGEAAVRREVLAVADAVSHPSYIDYPLVGDRPYSSQVSATLALRSPDRLIGVLNLLTLEQRAFDQEELEFIETVASEIAVAIENALLYSETDAQLRDRIQQLGTLRQMSRLVASTLDLSNVLDIVSRQAMELSSGLAVEIYRSPAGGGGDMEIIARQEADGQSLPPAVQADVANVVAEVVDEGTTVWRRLRPSDDLHVYAVPMLTGRRAVGAICVYMTRRPEDIVDIQGMLHAFSDSAAIAIENAELYDQARRGLRRASALLQEMHHRVRNNLQTVAALLSMQARHTSSPDLVGPLYEAVSRIRSIASVHDILSSGSISETSVDVIAKHVTDEASLNVVPPSMRVQFDISGGDVFVSSREATALALLINEFVTNAIFHGFSERTSGTIWIRAWMTGDVATLEVADDGKGLPESFDLGNSSRLGLQIARTLTESDLHGRLDVSSRVDGGTSVRVEFKPKRREVEPDDADADASARR
jgi:two-component system, sensor histidine kinase PdtaS